MAQLVENLIFKDTAGNSSIVNTGSLASISSAGNINFITSGGIIFNNTIDCSNNTIDNVVNVDSVNNSDIVISAGAAAQQLNFRTTNTTNRITISASTGGISLSSVSDCSVLPTLNTEFINFNTFTNVQSYTPAIQLSTGVLTVSYNERRGRYVQFGNLVYFTAYVRCTLLSGTIITANIRCTIPVSLPTGGFICPLVVGYYDNLSTGNVAVMYAQIDANATDYFTLYKKIDASATSNIPLDLSNTTNTFLFIVSGMYYLF